MADENTTVADAVETTPTQEVEPVAKKKEESTYTLEALMTSKKYMQDRNVLAIVLEEGREYTEAEVEKAIKTFQNMPIKEERV